MEKTNKKILIIEDDPNFVSILKQRFSEEGFLVVVAQDGKEAVSVSSREPVDIIISDILLPTLNGIDAIKKIKEKNPDMPVIFLTNIKDPVYLDPIKDMKKTECLIKSDVKLEEIVKKVKKHFK